MSHLLTILAIVLMVMMATAGISAAQSTSHAQDGGTIHVPKAPGKPRINGPKVYGVRPGSPMLFTVPTSGQRPIRFDVSGLPSGLQIDESRGVITGVVRERGQHRVTIVATNSQGQAKRELTIVVGDRIALTPPMGWNSWYCYWDSVTQEQMERAAAAMVNTGLIDHGFAYVCIDDGWSIKPNSPDEKLRGKERDSQGRINANGKFPDMKAMTDFIHARGLKAGIYTSPGPLTCAGYIGSYEHEAQDAARFAEWGFDFVKHDWCSYRKIVPAPSLEQLKQPYKLMGDMLRRQPRDMVYNLCQYGMGDVWTWGADVGGQSWRTAGDLGSHKTLYEGLIKDGFALDGKAHWVKPGAYNDPDYLQVGPLFRGEARAGRNLAPSPLTADEQYTHMSLWCLLAAPLFVGGDICNLDDFTIALLSNDEVIEVDQDPLCRQASRVAEDGAIQTWVKEMEDGSRAVGMFNTSAHDAPTTTHWKDIGARGAQRVRDLWRQKDMGTFAESFQATVPAHGVILVRIFPVQ